MLVRVAVLAFVIPRVRIGGRQRSVKCVSSVSGVILHAQPGLIVKDRIHNQGVAFPMSDRVAIESERQIFSDARDSNKSSARTITILSRPGSQRKLAENGFPGSRAEYRSAAIGCAAGLGMDHGGKHANRQQERRSHSNPSPCACGCALHFRTRDSGYSKRTAASRRTIECFRKTSLL